MRDLIDRKQFKSTRISIWWCQLSVNIPYFLFSLRFASTTTSHVRDLINRDQWKSTWLSWAYRARPFITTANTILNGVQKQKQQLAMEQSQGCSFLYHGSGLRKYYPRNSPGKYSFFHLSLGVSMSLHYIFTFCFTNSKLGAASILFKNLRERVTVLEICKSASGEA